MSKTTVPTDPNDDPYGYLGLLRHPDGSITRGQLELPDSQASSDLSNPSPALTKDVPINQSNRTWCRIYVPREVIINESKSSSKLPLIVYYHGGGFILCSASSLVFQDFCSTIAVQVPSVVVSVDYRLAPEDRLPAAYDDCAEALRWIKTTDEEWITKYADLTNCYLLGSSAGGNIAYHVGLGAFACAVDLNPLKIKGIMLHHPFFGGTKRSPSELRLEKDKVFPPCVADIMWELSLPLGVDRDHEYCNPTIMGIKTEVLDQVKALGCKILVTGRHGDSLVDRQIELVKMLEKEGIHVVGEFRDGGYHGVEFFDDSAAQELYLVIKEFVTASSANPH